MSEDRPIYKGSESDLQKLVVDYLRLHGCIVLETNQFFGDPRKVFKTGGAHATPDLLIHHRRWSKGLNFVVEMKTSTGKIDTKADPVTGYSQKYLNDEGASVVCRSLEDVNAAIEEFEIEAQLLGYTQRDTR